MKKLLITRCLLFCVVIYFTVRLLINSWGATKSILKNSSDEDNTSNFATKTDESGLYPFSSYSSTMIPNKDGSNRSEQHDDKEEEEVATIPTTAIKKKDDDMRDDDETRNFTDKWIINSTSNIRKWGCDRLEAPFTFVHIGKAGGGQVRRRLAFSALNVSRDRGRWAISALDNHYYPISPARQGKFCNSKNRHIRLPNSTLGNTYEGVYECSATTPVGIAVACPENKLEDKCRGCDDLESEHCDTVYVSHNFMGSELQWLPGKFLSKWWESEWSSLSSFSAAHKLSKLWNRLVPSNSNWCQNSTRQIPQGLNKKKAAAWYRKCSDPLARITDGDFQAYWISIGGSKNFSPIYASLPVHRVTVIRDPWTWLLSKFKWHRVQEHKHVTCDSTENLAGWSNRYLLIYLFYLCGVDCVSRYELKLMNLAEMEQQAASNLRQAFSVVGLLEESEEFFDLINKRIAYVNTSLHSDWTGGTHATAKDDEAIRCKKVYESPEFQEKAKLEVPILASLERLYKLGVQVNRFQKEELSRC